ALQHLRTHDAGRAGVLVADAGAQRATAPRETWPSLSRLGFPAEWVRDQVDAPEQLTGALDQALERVAAVADLTAAKALVRAYPDLTAVTADGDVLSA